ncbi:nuclear transport factor 2 family protein [Streptacidiphilus fuscans]|uniref:Nuclear transport factor 2 family protein n=1 Tax=Streptacidiphilus fuscans TaxID=2789292 RepID=A0A931BG41_9ACTN|nr:nuclear transport factor 2 family protein [Streptacidiphilus fuscans]MBF9072825.1 nuclear transport factor 2 family protein [Streptacidiphilus fuscans]
MSPVERNPGERNPGERNPAVLALRAAMEARDASAVLDTFAPDAVFRSPLTMRLVFAGRSEIGVLVEVLLDVLEDFHYTDEVSSGMTGFLAWSARIGGQPIEGTDLLRVGPEGKITEFTVFFRPLPATARALHVLGTRLVRRKSPAMARVVSGLTWPLAALTRAGDPIGARLIRSALSGGASSPR